MTNFQICSFIVNIIKNCVEHTPVGWGYTKIKANGVKLRPQKKYKKLALTC